MSDPVLPGEGPMTDEELCAVEAEWADYRASQTERTSFGAEMVPVAVDLLDHKLAQVFAEVRRLKAKLSETVLAVAAPAAQLAEIGAMVGYPDPPLIAETVHAELDRARSEHREQLAAKNAELNRLIQGMIDAGAEYSAKAENLRGELAETRSECAALTAKVEAARQGLADNLAEYEQVISSFGPSKTMSREEEEHRDLARAETAEARNCLAIFDAAMGSGMPHTPAQEARQYRCPNCDRWAPWTDGEMATVTKPPTFWCQTCSAETPLESMESRPVPQMPRNPAEINGDGLADVERGTGVREPQKPAQAAEGWYEFIHPTKATTHIAHVSEHGQVYLPETDLTEEDFYLAAASNRFWRLVRDLASLPVEEGP